MPSEQHPEKFKLVADPEDRGILREHEAGRAPEIEPKSGFGADPGRRRTAAGLEFEPLDAGAKAPRRRLLPIVVAVFTLAGFAAIVWYAYDWGVDYIDTARLPVILAEPGPIKSQPESPGGLEVPHLDTTVLNDVTPGPDRPQVERLLPPPETPKPPKTPNTAEANVGGSATSIEDRPPDAQVEHALPSPPLPSPPAAGATPAATSRTASAAPILSTPPAIAVLSPGKPLAATEESAESGVAASVPAPAPAPPAVRTAARTPSGAASGAYVVQLASLKARNAARPAWARLQKAYPKLLGDRELAVQAADLGERGTFYRVQAGFFPDRAGASALCQALKARRQDCLVVKR